MADDADRSDDRIQNTIDDGIREARRAVRELVPSGHCHWCDEAVPHGYLFCCGECREDWEHDHKRRKDTGK